MRMTIVCLGALYEMVEQLSQHGVKDADVDMDLLLEYVEAANSCDYCRAGDDQPDVDELTTKINQQLARRSQAQVEASDQSVLEFEPMVHLVTAAYAKNEGGGLGPDTFFVSLESSFTLK